LAALNIHRGLVLALVALEPDVGFPLPLEVTLLGRNAIGGPEERVTAEVFVPLLDETEARLIEDQAIHHHFFQRGVDVALALQQLIPFRHAAIRITHHAHGTTNPMMHAKRVVAL